MRQQKTAGAWRIGVVAVVAITAGVGALGCGGRAQRIRDARLARYEQQLMRHAQRATGCPAGQLTAQVMQEEPRVYTVLGCAQPVEYWLECDGRGRCRVHDIGPLHAVAPQALQCAPNMIQQQPTESPMVRYAAGCGRTAPFTMQCNGGACGWAQTGPAQAAGGAAQAASQPQQQPSQQQQVIVQPPQDDTAAATLESQVQTQREAILSCIDVANVTLRLRWTADGQVIVQLPDELHGTAAEGCIQAAIGALRVSAQQAGEVVVPLQ